jgi:multiple sugar transport system ATP-binding protein
VTLPPASRAAVGRGRDVTVGVRPHDVEVTAPGTGDADAVVAVVEPLGTHVVVHAEIAGGGADLVRVVTPVDHVPAPGTRLGLRVRPDRVHVFDTASGRRLA